MRFIKDIKENDAVSDVYFCKTKAELTTKNGKKYLNLTLQDKTGEMNAKIWEPDDAGIEEFEAGDYVEVTGDMTSFNNQLQMKVARARKVEVNFINEADYMPSTEKDTEAMMSELQGFIDSVEDADYKALLKAFFDDEEFVAKFKKSSAAKSMHHGYIGGLLEHTLQVTQMCDFYCKQYDYINRSLLITAAICHDIGKTVELSDFPENDYTDAGNLLGHIVIGVEMVNAKVKTIPDFPRVKVRELDHCILAHHGEHEFGSPKKPALIEALALNFADNTDAKFEIMRKALAEGTPQNADGWMGFNRAMDSNIRKTTE